MNLSFVVFGVGITAFGASIGLTQELLAQIRAVMMILFGAVLLAPALTGRFEMATLGMAVRADSRMTQVDNGGLRGRLSAGGRLVTVIGPPLCGLIGTISAVTT